MNTHMIANVVSSNFPCLTQFGQTGGLGPLFQSGIHMISREMIHIQGCMQLLLVGDSVGYILKCYQYGSMTRFTLIIGINVFISLISWPSGLPHWTQVLVLSECEFESRPGPNVHTWALLAGFYCHFDNAFTSQKQSTHFDL